VHVGAAGERADATHRTGPAPFTASLAELTAHVRARRAVVAAYLP
jgi:hypothetical protein